MAAVAMIRCHHVGALSDVNVNSCRVNLHQTRPQYIARVAPSEKYSPFREKPLQRVLISPYRANLLALKGYYIDENNIIRKDPDFKMVPMTENQKVPSDDAQFISAASAVAPYYQASSNSLGASSCGSQANSGEPIADAVSPSSTPTSSASGIESAPFDKELPPKPVLRYAESPERRGIYDAFDSGLEKVKFAPLEPSAPNAASPSLTGSDSFELSPSLRFDAYNSPRVSIGATVNARKISANPVVVRPKNSSDEDNHSGIPLKATKLERASLPVSTQRRLPTTGQITALRNASPVSRHAPKSRLNSNTSQYGTQKRIQRPRSEIKGGLRAIENISDAGSGPSSGFGSPQRLDDLTRRSIKYGLGATIRSSHDAHEIIMGESRSFSGVSNSAGTGLSSKSAITGDSSKALLPKVPTNDKTHIHRADRFPPRVSSLPGSASDVVTKPSVASRLARPTKASSARAAANAPLRKSGTMTSVKKFGSRLSSIIPGHRRSDLPDSVDKSNGVVGVDEKNAAGARLATVKENSSSNTGYPSSIDGRALQTTYEDSGMGLKCPEFVGPDALMGEPTDRAAPQQSQRDEQERQAAAFYASEAHIRTNNGRTNQAAIQQGGRRQDDEDEPPTPPPTRNGPQGHYIEEERMDDPQEVQHELQLIRDAAASFTPPTSHDHFNEMMRQAENTLQLLTLSTGRVEDPEVRRRMIVVVQAVGESISAANRAAAAIISHRDANERLLAATVALGGFASRMSARAVQMSSDQ